METIEKTLNDVEKTFSTPTYAPGGAMVRENLLPMVTRLEYRETPIRDRLARKPGNGQAASWNVMTAMGSGNSAFAEGGTPNEDVTTYERRSAIYKELGKTKIISDRMIAAGRSFTDQEAEQLEVGMREVIQDEETYLITGNTGVSVLQFDGLDAYITTNVTDDANNALGFRTDLLDTEVANILNSYGVRPTAIFCSYGMKRAINQSLAGDVRVNIDSSNTVATGLEVGFYQSMVGKLPIIATPGISDDSGTYPGNTVSNIYVVTEKAQGQDCIYFEDLYPLSKVMLDRTGAAVKFMVTECTVLVCRAEEFSSVVQNVRIS